MNINVIYVDLPFPPKYNDVIVVPCMCWQTTHQTN